MALIALTWHKRSTYLTGVLAGVLASGLAFGQSCPINVPHVNGTWEVLPFQMPINPIQASLLPTGKVLIVAGSENDAKNNSSGAESYRAAVWDSTVPNSSGISVQNLTYDVFCSGTAALPDGRALVVGGTSDYSFKGENRASFFDPKTGTFAQSQRMQQGRWYASTIALGDGRVMAMSGLTETGGTSTTVEIFDLKNAGAGWNPPTGVPFSPPLYPRISLLPNGTVFYSGQGSGGSNPTASIFNPANGAWTTSAAITRDRSYGSSVLLPLLPPNYVPRVMNFGGGNPAASTTEIIDLSAASPSWTPGPNMSTGRIQMNAILLPNGNVLAEGGSVNNEAPDTPGKAADLYDPVTNTMRPAGSAAYSRLYHSTALLLPDATVMSMGSNPGDRGSYLPAIEIYTPPYLFDSADRLITTGRPSITGIAPATAVLGYGSNFSVNFTSTSPIASAVLVRPGSVTHAFDMEQRVIGLCGASPQPACAAGSTLALTIPTNNNVAPPGYYMLFLIDSAGVPSKARFVQLTPYPTSIPPPTALISSPAQTDITVLAGGTVSFATASTAARYSWVFPGGYPGTSTAQNPGNVTYSTPGVYRASLTVIDANGNSDPSPPTRTITVNPSTPDYSISVAEAAKEVFPGGSATYTVTVKPVSGFSGPVSLSVGSESGFPTGITSAGFSPATISGSGTSTLTMTTTIATVPWALSLTVTGTSGSLSHTASSTLLVNLAPPAALTASPGDRQVALAWPASVGATGYHVKRSAATGGPYSVLACQAPNLTSYTDSTLNNGTPYFYAVSAAFTGNPNAGGESANSKEASAIPQSSQPPPPPPAPTNLSAKATKPGSLDLQWTQSTGSGITQNHLYRRTANGSYPSVATATLNATTFYRDSTLISKTTYCYVVSARNSAAESARSSEVCAASK